MTNKQDSKIKIKKPSEIDTKSEVIRVLATPEQKEAISRAAADAGLSASSWLLSAGLRALSVKAAR